MFNALFKLTPWKYMMLNSEWSVSGCDEFQAIITIAIKVNIWVIDTYWQYMGENIWKEKNL